MWCGQKGGMNGFCWLFVTTTIVFMVAYFRCRAQRNSLIEEAVQRRLDAETLKDVLAQQRSPAGQKKQPAPKVYAFQRRR